MEKLLIDKALDQYDPKSVHKKKPNLEFGNWEFGILVVLNCIFVFSYPLLEIISERWGFGALLAFPIILGAMIITSILSIAAIVFGIIYLLKKKFIQGIVLVCVGIITFPIVGPMYLRDNIYFRDISQYIAGQQTDSQRQKEEQDEAVQEKINDEQKKEYMLDYQKSYFSRPKKVAGVEDDYKIILDDGGAIVTPIDVDPRTNTFNAHVLWAKEHLVGKLIQVELPADYQPTECKMTINPFYDLFVKYQVVPMYDICTVTPAHIYLEGKKISSDSL